MSGAKYRTVARRWLPPAVLEAVGPYARRFLLNRNGATKQWELLPAWPPPGKYRGWSAEAIARVQQDRWSEFLRAVDGPGPLGIVHETRHPARYDFPAHNTVMAFAYVVGRAALQQPSVSILDWGGGIGHWYVIAKALFPDLEMRYAIHDFPESCRIGAALLPQVTFISDPAEALSTPYDLIMASGSLQYSEDWRSALGALARAARHFLYVSRMPIVRRHGSFVVLQRPYSYGYDSEYAGWVLHRDEFLDAAAATGYTLVREFLIGETIHLDEIPEPCQYAGYLFAPDHHASSHSLMRS